MLKKERKTMIGLKRGYVELQEYTDEWHKLYKIEEETLRNLIREYFIDIQHIGSTSVEGLKAKPIIDILIGVKNFNNLEIIIAKLQHGGYIYRLNASTKERILFVKGSEEERTHHIHIVQWMDEEWNNNILFRNYLRKYGEVAKEYSDLKDKLAELFKEDRTSYTSGKNQFIQGVIERAKREFL